MESAPAPAPEAVERDYTARLASRRAALADRERQHVLFSRVRLVIVALAIGLAWWRGGLAWPWILAAAGLIFFVVSMLHSRALDARERAQRAVRWYEDGVARLRHEWIGRGEASLDFRPLDHLYADDLDLFGRGSLFELLATARTRGGLERLASWLVAPADPAVVRERQEAVRELASMPDLRETMAVAGEGTTLASAVVREWAGQPSRMPADVWSVLLALISAANITLLAIYLSSDRLGLASYAVLLIQLVFVFALQSRVRPVIDGADSPARNLRVLATLLRILEGRRFRSPALRRLESAISGGPRPASAEIARLERRVARLAWRQNLVFVIPAGYMAWATQCAFSIDRWRRAAGPRVPAWLDAVSELEALSSLATFAAEHPDYAYPAFEAGPAHLAARALAHPLLPASAVANDVAIGGDAPCLLLVSGSNMSGKSTFLRAIGVNVVLAGAGAPVRAASVRLTPLVIGASIRTLDSLQDGRSRFFAEVTRLKAIVDLSIAGRTEVQGDHVGRTEVQSALRSVRSVLFLLDEILAGTNSHDRALGAEALLAGLVRSGGIGLATTHDLALSRIADAPDARAANVHFADRFDAGGLSFDYLLRPGPVRTSNALALMRSIGLDV